MLKKKISPSIMCADFANLKDVLKIFHEENIDYLHLDIMDGHFVPNIALGESFISQLRNITDIPFDYHFMVDNPEDKIEWFDIRKGDMASVHFESTSHVQRILSRIRDKGVKAGIALNPSTPVMCLDYIMEDIDYVVVMTVNPGYAGQSVVKQSLKKIGDVREYLNKRGYDNISIEVDGCVSYENAEIMRDYGADIFVAGTSSVFNRGGNLKNNIDRLKRIINSGEL